MPKPPTELPWKISTLQPPPAPTSYKTNSRKVQKFMMAFGQTIRNKPTWPSAEEMELRLDLIDEEVGELKDAVADWQLI